MPVSVYLLGAVTGASGAVAAQLVNNWLTSRRDFRRFRIETFERFRSQFRGDENLNRIGYKEGPLTEREIDEYVGFWEEMALYFSQGLLDQQLVDEIFGDYIIECYQDDEIMRSIGSARGKERDPTYFEHFENLAKLLVEKKKRRLQ